jgi:hypothetical protein
MTISTCRKPHLAEKIIMHGGLDGCGKTLFSPIISSLDRVELPTYSYEIEHYCALNYLEKLSLKSTSTLIRMQTDLKLYHTMMGREVNFRPTDLSSVQMFHSPTQYFERLFMPGDEVIPDVINEKNPILNLIIHNILFISDPIWKALGSRCVYIEVVRHPLYMVRQQILNMQKLIDDVRDFIIYYERDQKTYPYWTKGWEDIFDQSSDIERSVHYIDQMTQRVEKAKKSLKEKYKANILTIPFEQFVLDPDPWVEKIAKAVGSKITENTRNVMFQQKVPREKIAQGLDLEIYRRCGWVPPKDGTSEREELMLRRKDVEKDSSPSSMKVIDRLSDTYEEKYWKPEN